MHIHKHETKYENEKTPSSKLTTQLDKFFKKHNTAINKIKDKRGIPLTKLISELKTSERAQCPIHMLLKRIAWGNFKRSSKNYYQVDLEIQHELVTLLSTTLLRKLAAKISQTNIEEKDLFEIARLIRQRYKTLRKEENDKYRRKSEAAIPNEAEASTTIHNPFTKYKTPNPRVCIPKL